MIQRPIPALVAALALAGLVGTTAAQTAAPAPASPSSSAPIPKHNCGKPGEYPGNLASDRQKQTWQKEYVGYIDCLKKFVEAEQALAEPHVKASNAAINEYNAGVKEYNEIIKKIKGD